MREATLDAWIETSADALIGSFEERMTEQEGTFADREAAALALANVIVRRWIERELRCLASTYEDEVVVDGDRYRRHASGELRYHTLCGAVSVRRDTYRRIGVHNGPTVVPLELEAGIVENATPALAHSVLQAFATMPLRHYEDEMYAAHRKIPSRSTLERIAKRIAADLHEDLAVIEPALRKAEPIAKDAASISIGVDRTTIPMAEQLPALPDYWHRKLKRRPPPPIVVAFRMAYVATISVNDADGESLSSKRVCATADEGPTEMMERLMAELQHVLKERPNLPVVIIQDGAPELWSLVDEALENEGIEPSLQLIDRYHLETRLAALAEIVERDGKSRCVLLDEWRAALDRSDTAVKRICARVERDLDDVGLFNRRIAEGHLAYCHRYQDKMRYASARKRGLPIGSGVTEGACKSVIASRFKRSGQRWFEVGASACLQMRSLYLNHRLDRAVSMHRDRRRESIQLN